MKNLLLTLLLCVAGTAWAQITAVSELNNNSAYTIKSVNRGFLYWTNGSGFDSNYLTSSSHTTITDATPDGNDANQRFAFLRGTNTAAGKYYLYCIAANKFVGQEGTTVKLKLYDTPTETITLTKKGNYFVMKFSNGKSININNNQAFQGCKVVNANPDEGNKMTITSVATVDLADVITAIDNYEAQTEVSTAKNNALEEIARLRTASYYTKSSDAIQTAEDAVNSVDLAYVNRVTKPEYVDLISTAMANLYKSASENPLTNGAKIVLNNRLYPNKYPAANATGNEMIRGNEKNYASVWEVEMKDEANGVFYLKNPYTGKYCGRYGDGGGVRYGLVATTETAGSFKILNESAQEGYVAFQPQEKNNGTALTGTTAATQCYIHLDVLGKVVSGSANTDNTGSHFLVQAVSDEDIATFETTARTNLQNALTAVDEAPSNYTIGTDLGEYQVKDKTAAQTVYNNNNAATACELDQATASITPPVIINQPQVGKLYRFKPWDSTKYISAETTAGTIASLQLKEGYDWQSVIFQLCENGKILSFGNGTYMTEATYSGIVGSSAGDNMVFDASPMHKGYYTIRSTTADRYLYNNISFVERNPEYEADRCDWKIEEVAELPISINSPYNVGTVYSPVALNKKSERLKFYTGEVIGSELVLTEYTEDVIPANVPFVVVKQNEAPTNGCMFLEINKTAKPTFEGTNHLRGQYESFAKGENSYYTLQPAWDENGENNNSATDVAFRLFNGTNLQGFRAYLPATLVTGSSLSIRFEGEDDITGIDNTLTNANGKQEIFDLTGRRVSRATKGLYIINGQKVLVK